MVTAGIDRLRDVSRTTAMSLSAFVCWSTVVVMTTSFSDTDAHYHFDHDYDDQHVFNSYQNTHPVPVGDTHGLYQQHFTAPSRRWGPSSSNVVTLDFGSDREVIVKCPPAFRECVDKYSSSPMSADNINLWCLRIILHQMTNCTRKMTPRNTPAPTPSPNTGSGRFEGIRSLLQRLQRDGLERPPSGQRSTRQEYRTLSVAQRDRFHRALQVLYEDGIMEEMVGIHSDAFQNGGAHRGVAFLPWHRFFISIFEQALIQVDSQVTLPYWDSTIDNNMGASAWRSVMWDAQHLGSPAGAVISGPFSGWTALDGDLVRNIDTEGNPFRQARMNELLEDCRIQEYSPGIEASHNNVHLWVGGTMARASGPSDPVFYMVHAFVDLQWERFREHQRADCNIDPSTDYPTTNDPPHGSTELMDGWDPSLAFPNRDGIRDSWTQNWFTYADPPSCSNNCGNSPDMSCDSGSNVCVGREIGASRRRRKREAMAAIRAVEAMRKSRSKRSYGVVHECKQNPYGSSCPKPHILETYHGVAEAMLSNKLTLPRSIKQLKTVVQDYRRRVEKVPESNCPVMFSESLLELPNCVTRDVSPLAILEDDLKRTGYQKNNINLQGNYQWKK